MEKTAYDKLRFRLIWTCQSDEGLQKYGCSLVWFGNGELILFENIFNIFDLKFSFEHFFVAFITQLSLK